MARIRRARLATGERHRQGDETMNDATPAIGHNSASFMEMIEHEPGIIFRDETALDGLVRELNEWISSAEVDLSTDKGRKAVASRAALIARRKTAIDEHGKSLNEERRKEINAVDAVRREVRNKLDELRDLARKPLTDWEQAEQRRQQKVDDIRKRIADRSNPHVGASAHHIEHLIHDVTALVIDEAEIGSQALVLEKERREALARLERVRDEIAKAEAERAELEQLRREKAERERQERESVAQEAQRAPVAPEAPQEGAAPAPAPSPTPAPAPAPSAPPSAAPEPPADDGLPLEKLSQAREALERDCGLSSATARVVVRAVLRRQIPHMRLEV